MHGGNVWQGGDPAKWLDFSANLRPEGPPDWVRDALLDAVAEAAYYPDPPLWREREALGRWLELPPDRVLPTAGGTEAIALAAGVEASRMLVFAPCFGEYARQAGNRGRPVCPAPLLTARHTPGDPAALAGEVLAKGDAAWLCNPVNPLGTAFSREQVSRLLELVEAKEGWLIVDEAFIDCCPECSARPLLAAHGRLVIVGSMTKILGIPGVRLGYVCARPGVLEALARGRAPWALNCFAGAALRALPGHREDVRRYAAENARRREAFRTSLESLGAFVYSSRASFLLADFARPVAPLAAALKQRGILVRECMDFAGIDDGAHLRFAVRTDAENQRLIAALKEAAACAGNR